MIKRGDIFRVDGQLWRAVSDVDDFGKGFGLGCRARKVTGGDAKSPRLADTVESVRFPADIEVVESFIRRVEDGEVHDMVRRLREEIADLAPGLETEGSDPRRTFYLCASAAALEELIHESDKHAPDSGA